MAGLLDIHIRVLISMHLHISHVKSPNKAFKSIRPTCFKNEESVFLTKSIVIRPEPGVGNLID